MPNSHWICAIAAIAAIFAGATFQPAEAGNSKRKQRAGASQMMRLGGPAADGNGTGSFGGFVDRTGGPSLRTDSDVRRFFEGLRNERRGPG